MTSRATMAGKVLASLLVTAIVFALCVGSARHQARASADAQRFRILEAAAAASLHASASIASAYGRVREAATLADAEPSTPDAALLALEIPYPVWRAVDGNVVVVAGDMPDIDLRPLATAFADVDWTWFGPMTTADGRDVLAIRLAGPDNPARAESTLGILIPLDELWLRSGLSALVADGVNVTVSRPDGMPIYRSSPVELESPVTTSLLLPGSEWAVAAAPGAGWSGIGDLWYSLVVGTLLAAALGIASYGALAKPEQLRQQLAAATARLAAKEASISELLVSRSQLRSDLANSLTIDLPTGLQNKTSLLESLQARLARTRRTADGGIYVAAVHFPRLDKVSRSIGSNATDMAVVEWAETLRECVGDPACIGRTGEKEFSLFVDSDRFSGSAELAEFLSGHFDARVRAGRRFIYSPPTIGIVVSADGYEHGPDLVANAGLAAVTAAEEGRTWSAFNPESRESGVSLLQLESDLQAAVAQGELRLHFQPIVNLQQRRIVGLESLLRWKHPTESWIGPDRFIPLAESMGLMQRISEWVIRQAVGYARQWSEKADAEFYVTVNLTPRDLNQDLLNHLFQTLQSAHLPPERLRVEITETAVVRDMRIAARLIGELCDRGIAVLLDDFGTGYSSLSYLRDLPFKVVKLDKSFIHRLTSDARDFGLVRSIVSLVHYLGMECVAEGIETQDQLDLVEMVDCNYGQGFLFSRPLPPGEVEAILTKSVQPQLPSAAVSA